jgi:hypothetical protein
MKLKYTTLNKIRACSPCSTGWNKLLKHLNKTKADDDLLPFEVIFDSNGLDDALWCMRSAPEYDREWRLFAVWCSQQVQHLNTDPRVSAAINAAEDYANRRINLDELDAARSAARSAARNVAGDVEWDAAWDVARSATGDATWAAQKQVFRWIVNGGLTKFEAGE